MPKQRVPGLHRVGADLGLRRGARRGARRRRARRGAGGRRPDDAARRRRGQGRRSRRRHRPAGSAAGRRRAPRRAGRGPPAARVAPMLPRRRTRGSCSSVSAYHHSPEPRARMGSWGCRRRRSGRAAGTLRTDEVLLGRLRRVRLFGRLLFGRVDDEGLELIRLGLGVGIPGRVGPRRGRDPARGRRRRRGPARVGRIGGSEEAALGRRRRGSSNPGSAPLPVATDRLPSSGQPESAAWPLLGRGDPGAPGACAPRRSHRPARRRCARPRPGTPSTRRSVASSSSPPGRRGRAGAALSPRSSGCARRARRRDGHGPRPGPRTGRPRGQRAVAVPLLSRADDTAGSGRRIGPRPVASGEAAGPPGRRPMSAPAAPEDRLARRQAAARSSSEVERRRAPPRDPCARPCRRRPCPASSRR